MKNRAIKILLSFSLSVFLTVAFISGCAVNSRKWFVETIKKNYYYEIDEDAFKETDFKEFSKNHLDMYSQYYTAEEYKEVQKSDAGSKIGIGISYSFFGGKGVYVSSVVGNSPAYNARLRAGEWLKSGSVNGREVTFGSARDFSELVASAGDGDRINLTSVDGTEYAVSKAEYRACYTFMATNKEAWTFGDSADGGLSLVASFESIPYLPDGSAYIKLNQFYGTAAQEFDILLKKFNAEKCTSLILDLRSNGGGYVSVMQKIAYAFSGSTGTLAMLARDKYGKETKFDCEKVNSAAQTLSGDTEVYVLANSGTASASEALIGAMVCYGFLDFKNIFISDYSEEYLDLLVQSGQSAKTAVTYGKGIMQSTFVYEPTQEALKLTTAKIYWPDSVTCIHDVGLRTEDGCTAVKAQWQHTKGDEELKSAVEIIKAR